VCVCVCNVMCFYICHNDMCVNREGFPINPGGSLQRTFDLTPLLKENRVRLTSVSVASKNGIL